MKGAGLIFYFFGYQPVKGGNRQLVPLFFQAVQFPVYGIEDSERDGRFL